MNPTYLTILVIGFLVLAVLMFVLVKSDHTATPRRTINFAQYHYSDDLAKSILMLIGDAYSPLAEARMTDHLSSDLDLDSLDMVDLLFDCSYIAGAELNAHELYQKYGRNPTIAQLISYIRSAQSSENK